MKNERDKFLTEAMGECWHEWEGPQYYKQVDDSPRYVCQLCGIGSAYNTRQTDFSTWTGFGKLWEWAQGQEWWGMFGDKVIYDESDITHEKHQQWISDLEWFIRPDRFADAIYIFLKERQP